MFINLDTNIDLQFSNVYQLENQFCIWASEIIGDSSYIENVNIILCKSSYGTTYPKIQHNNITFDIELDSEILSFIESDFLKAKAIFQHEIYHCKDIKNQFENKVFDENYFSNKIHTTYDFILDLALSTWSEFYATYYSVKNNHWDEKYDIESDIIFINTFIDYIHRNSRVGYLMKFPNELLYDFRNFTYRCSTMIAFYLNENNEDIVKKYTKKNKNKFPEYFYKILNEYQRKLSSYPNWLEQKEFVNFGKIIFSILSLNQINFSTDDLSDELFFRCTK